MPDFKTVFHHLRTEYGFNQEQIAQKLNVSKSSIAMWETGNRKPTPEKYEEIADFFNVDMDYLFGRSTIKRKISYDEYGNEHKALTSPTVIPVLGSVPAGIPIEAIQDIVDFEEIDADTAAKGEYFALKIKGDSMEPRICEGDVVIVRKQDDVESGDIAIVMVNGNDATIKRLLKYQDGIRLMPSNPTYDPLYFTNEEIEDKPVRIIGKVVENRQKY